MNYDLSLTKRLNFPQYGETQFKKYDDTHSSSSYVILIIQNRSCISNITHDYALNDEKTKMENIRGSSRSVRTKVLPCRDEMWEEPEKAKVLLRLSEPESEIK